MALFWASVANKQTPGGRADNTAGNTYTPHGRDRNVQAVKILSRERENSPNRWSGFWPVSWPWLWALALNGVDCSLQPQYLRGFYFFAFIRLAIRLMLKRLTRPNPLGPPYPAKAAPTKLLIFIIIFR